MGIDFPLATETRSKVIDDLLLKLRENYMFPDVAKEMELNGNAGVGVPSEPPV